MPDDTMTSRDAGANADLTDRPKAGETRVFLLAVAILAAVTLAMFGDVLFGGKYVVVSYLEDIIDAFVPWRQFGFDELKQGNLAMWNPHLFSGSPFVGGIERGMLYPVNYLHLVLPVGTAINWTIALHVFLGGVFMYLWAQHRGLHPLARLLAAALFMFCAPQFTLVYAGHLASAATWAWAPLVLLSIDGLFRSRSLGWCLLGAFAVCMQILAGQVQFAFITGVAAAVYTAMCLVRSPQQLRVAAGFVGMYVGGAALAGAQLLIALDSAGETIRSAGMPFWFATDTPLYLDSFVRLVAPSFFGSGYDGPLMGYWGPWTYWDPALFISVTGLVLAVYGAVLAPREKRRFSLGVALICLVLAMGHHTPLFKYLYLYMPGFNMFRYPSRFGRAMSLFLIMLAAGLDTMIRRPRAVGRTALAAGLAGAILGAGGLVIRASALAGNPDGWWEKIVRAVCEYHVACYLTFRREAALLETGVHASSGLLIAAGTLLVLAVLVVGLKRYRGAAFCLALLGAAEVFTFARLIRPAHEYPGPQLRIEDLDPDVRRVKELLAGQKGDYRIMNMATRFSNCAMTLPWGNVWGHDSHIILRYAEFMAFTQGLDPDYLDENMKIYAVLPMHSMLRMRFVVDMPDGKFRALSLPDPLRRLELIRDCRVIEGRDSIFEAMAAESFDPRRTVILETPPDPWPSAFAEGGSARIVDASTDHLTIEAELPAPAILLITDTYAKGWRAVALPGSDQDSYRLLPGNYVLRAVPLKAGHHRLRVEYAPPAFRAGVWVSAVSLAAYLALLGWHVRRRMR